MDDKVVSINMDAAKRKAKAKVSQTADSIKSKLRKGRSFALGKILDGGIALTELQKNTLSGLKKRLGVS